MSYHFKSIVFLMFVTTAPLLQSGGCVVDGMNIWQLSECIACSVGAYFEVTQANYATSFTVSGHYKLCENIDGASTGTVAIAASNVILDLGGYTISNMSALTVANGLSNVVIRNGMITDTTNCCTLMGSNQNIVFEDIVIDTIVPDVANAGTALSSTGGITGLLVHNVTIYDGSSTNIVISGSSNSGVIFDNVQCINTNPAFFTIPSNPSAVIYLQTCNNLVMRNISLINQWQELNGILLDTCDDVEVDGVSITSSLSSTDTPTAYQLMNGETGVHKNIFIDGGANKVYEAGIANTGATLITFDSCVVQNMKGAGIALENSCAIFNSVVNNCGAEGFFIGAETYVGSVYCKW